MKNLVKKISDALLNAYLGVELAVKDETGDGAVSFIGGLIAAVVVIGLLIVGIKQFFPSFFESFFQKFADTIMDMF